MNQWAVRLRLHIYNNIPLLVALGVLYFFYSFGLDGIFFFDDPPTLDGLLFVNDWPSAWFYIVNGQAGPLGRPVAMASFLLNASAYPDSAGPFLITNTWIHLINVLLLASIIRRLQKLCPDLFSGGYGFAPLAAGLWGILPILASTSMMVVQRMTSLSATFVLIGIFVYLWGRARQTQTWSVWLTIFGVGLCTVLAMLTKENGVLLPVFLVIIEWTLLPAEERNTQMWPQRYLRAAIVLPSVALGLYMLWILPGSVHAYGNRAFSLSERLFTQPVILWDYLRLAFLPRPFALGPFHDDYRIYQAMDWEAWLAGLAWLAAFVGALIWRRRYPVVAFAVLWYLAGHFIESSWIALELYFEHRNYLPLIGPVLALAWGFSRMPLSKALKYGLSGLYFCFLAFVLWQVTSIWGNRELELWARQHPASPRAVQTMAHSYVSAGRLNEAQVILDRALLLNPALSSVAMQGLRLRCMRGDAEGVASHLAMMRTTLANSHFSYLALFSLDAIRKLHEQGACPFLRTEDLQQISEQLLANPKFSRARTQAALWLLQARLFLYEQQHDLAIELLQKAFHRSPDQEVLILLYKQLLQQGRTADARELLHLAIDKAPKNPILRQQWIAVVEQLES